MFFDTHAHYDDKRFNDDRFETINKAYESGVSYILNAASSVSSIDRCIKLTEEFDFVYASVGVHPHNASDMNEDVINKIEKLAKKDKVVAIGEIGLDYHYDFSPRDIQKYWFRQQIELAKRVNLPVIIHDRESHEDIMNIVKESNVKEVGGVFHCYSGSVEMVKEVLNNNLYISFGGPVTFKNVKKLADVVKAVPNDRILIETDSPYLTPEPFRGKRNDSSYVRYVAEKIAEIKGLRLEDIGEITTENGKKLFKGIM